MSEETQLSLTTKLSKASEEIMHSQDSLNLMKEKYKKLESEKLQIEQILINERNDFRQKLKKIQMDLVSEKEVFLLLLLLYFLLLWLIIIKILYFI